MSKIKTGIFKTIPVPTANDLDYQLEKFQQLGVISPEDVPLIQQNPSLLQSFVENPEVTGAQLQSLHQLQDLSSGKMTDIDKANLQQLMTQQAQAAKAQRDAIISNAQQRGVSGSGLEMAAQLQNEQEMANRGNAAATQAMLAAQERGVNALNAAGQLAGNMRAQDMDVAAKKAAAIDEINRFNAQNRQNVAQTNVQARNQAQQQNLATQQRIAEANVGQVNQQRQNESANKQQEFENRYKIAQGVSGIAAQNAQANAAKDANKAAMLGAALGTVGAMFSDARAKEDIKPWNPSDFLDSIAPVKYKYKPEMGMGAAEHKGVLAQDVEAHAPEAVTEIGGVKALKLDELVPMLLAAMGDINKRVKDIEGKK